MISAALVLLLTSPEAASCLPVETDITLTGKAYHKRIAGPPTYGETPGVDMVEHITFLDLDRAIRVCADGEFRDADVEGVQTIQLGRPSKIRSGRVTVRGKLFFSHTGHHYTQVLMAVEAVDADR